jgi:hypothetical protein
VRDIPERLAAGRVVGVLVEHLLERGGAVDHGVQGHEDSRQPCLIGRIIASQSGLLTWNSSLGAQAVRLGKNAYREFRRIDGDWDFRSERINHETLETHEKK